MYKIEKNTEFNHTKDEKIKVLCSNCNSETNHLALQSVDTSGRELVDTLNGIDIWISWSDNYQIVQCNGCETISFRHKRWFSEYEGPEYGQDGSQVKLYPSRTKDTLSEKDFHCIPVHLKRIYRETISSFNNELFTLCAAGLRAITEGICSDQNITDGPVEIDKKGETKIVRKSDLRAKIAGLTEKGILPQKSSMVLHEHRFLGNDAVHELAQPSIDELKIALHIIEHTLEELYEIPSKGAELNARRLLRREKK